MSVAHPEQFSSCGRKRAFVLAALLVVCFSAPAALAKEGGDQYPNGAENWYAGAAPAAGFYYVNYLGYYGGKLRNGAGQPARLDGGVPSVNASFDALRFVEMTRFRIAGADYGVHIIVPLVDQSVNIAGRSSNGGVGDITINPLILGWHHARWQHLVALDIILPSGYYDANDARVSLGAHYTSFEPVFAFSYLPRSGWEGSAKIMYDVKTANSTTHDHSGQEFHIDYGGGKHIGKWMLGSTGYLLKQTTADTISGVIAPAASGLWDRGHFGQVISTGPSLGYTNERHLIFMAQWQHEMLVRSRFGGDKVWVKLIIPMNGLLGRLR